MKKKKNHHRGWINGTGNIIESMSKIIGTIIGTFIARCLGPLMKYALTSYRNEMVRYIPEILVQLRACNEILISIMEETQKKKCD